MGNTQKERIYKFDNIKLFTMIMVVVVHAIEIPYDINKISDLFRSLVIFIYSFHMPLFVFVSGLMQKRFSDTNKLNINKIAYFITLGFILKIVLEFFRYLNGEEFAISYFGDKSIEWYLFALCMFMVTAYATRKVHPAVMLSVSFICGTFCGYINFIDDTLYLSRYFVFLPIYLSGYYLTPEKLIRFEKKGAVKLVSGAGALLYFIFCFRNLKAIYKLRLLFTARHPFSNVAIDNCGFEHRLLCYLISAILCLAVFCYIPNIKIPVLSGMGKNTLSVYFYHNAIIFGLAATPFFEILKGIGDPMYKVILLFFAIVLTLVLSFDFFMLPLNLLAKLFDKFKKSWCYVIIFAPFVIGLASMYKELPGYFNYLLNKIKNIFA